MAFVAFGLNNDEEEPKNETSDSALMTLYENEFGLVRDNRGHHKYDILERDPWIGNTGASTHTNNSDEGMFYCYEAVNQYIKVGSSKRLQILRKECKRCTIVQKNGKVTHCDE